MSHWTMIIVQFNGKHLQNEISTIRTINYWPFQTIWLQISWFVFLSRIISVAFYMRKTLKNYYARNVWIYAVFFSISCTKFFSSVMTINIYFIFIESRRVFSFLCSCLFVLFSVWLNSLVEQKRRDRDNGFVRFTLLMIVSLAMTFCHSNVGNRYWFKRIHKNSYKFPYIVSFMKVKWTGNGR